MSILDVKNLTQIYGDKKLFQHANMQLFGGDKLGLTGLNGAGKSTFINILIGEVIPDEGYVKWNPKVRLGYLDQQAQIRAELTVRAYLSRAFAPLYQLEDEIAALNQEISVCKDDVRLMELCDEVAGKQEQLEDGGFYAIDSTIDKVAAGLGITAFGMDTPVSILSGGQRAKVMLAKLLLESPDVLLLDEPTNFLDTEHIAWLTKFLNSFKGTFILVSHDYDFLNQVVNCICDIEFGTITRFNGTYESFVKQKEAKREQYLKDYNAQQKEVAKLETFIEKNIVRASTSKMAKSRRKRLEKMDRLEKPQEAPRPSFLFSYTPPVGKTVLWVEDLAIGYTDQLVPDISMELKTGQKLAVTGFNGIGKSTFIKTLCGLIPPLAGSYRYTDKLVIGYFEQENRFEDVSLSPLQELKNMYPNMLDKDVRTALSRCGLRNDQVLQKLSTLSGGEQAKVKLCKLMLTPCNLLLLDEPTNHLDVNAIEQLKVAIRLFEGTVLFVSHSKEFCRAVADSTLDFEALFD